METEQNGNNQQTQQHNPTSTTAPHNVEQPSSGGHHQLVPHQHHGMNELALEVQQHVNEEVVPANYETVYVIEVKISSKFINGYSNLFICSLSSLFFGRMLAPMWQ